MLTIADDLSTYTLAAGEPFLLDLHLRDAQGVAVPLAGRAFVLSFHDDDRETRHAIAGERFADDDGDHVRFAGDGRLSESLYGWPLIVELAERFHHGRDVIARGGLTILPSATGVASLDPAGIADVVLRVTIRAGADGAAPGFSQTRIPFVAAAPAPVALNPLVIATASLTVGIPVDLPIAGMTAGALLAATLPPGLVLTGSRITGSPAAAGAVDLTLVETLAGATNSPRTTVIPVAVIAPPVLMPLSLSGVLENGVASIGTIAGATAGSQLSTASPALTIDSAARTYAFDGTAAAGTTVALVETLVGATGSPRATALSVTAPAAVDAVLAPYSVGTVDLGTRTALDYRDLTVAPYTIGARFRRATNTADFWFGMIDAGNGFIFRIIDDDHYRLMHVVDGQQNEIGGYEYRTFSPPLVAAPGTAFIELRVAADGSAAFYQDGAMVSATIPAAFLDTLLPERGTGIRFAVTVGPAMAAVTAGSLVPPLAIGTTAFDPATRRIDLSIAYTGAPDRYDYALDSGAWAAARTLSTSAAGRAVIRLPALAPGVTGNVTVMLRQHNAPAVGASTTIAV